MKQRIARRQIMNLDALPVRIREAVMASRGKPVLVAIPKLGVLELPRPKGARLQ